MEFNVTLSTNRPCMNWVMLGEGEGTLNSTLAYPPSTYRYLCQMFWKRVHRTPQHFLRGKTLNTLPGTSDGSTGLQGSLSTRINIQLQICRTNVYMRVITVYTHGDYMSMLLIAWLVMSLLITDGYHKDGLLFRFLGRSESLSYCTICVMPLS